MSEPLWHWDELVAASGGEALGAAAEGITGVSIDTRTIEPGDLFVALTDQRDGHDFVGTAFANGAAAALVAKSYQAGAGDGALIQVDDPLRALEVIGRAARARSKARVMAVTGSVGKTGSKEALRQCLSLLGRTHASEKSYNNHWGVPLTLARMPRDTEFGVFEIGMNHPGEITPLVQMVRPQVALITTVEPVHLGQFNSVEDIAMAKAEIFDGLEIGGTAILNRDNAHYDLLKAAALAKGARVLPFGTHKEAVALLVEASYGPDGSDVRALIEGTPLSYRVGAPGEHLVMNSLGVLASIKMLGGDVLTAAGALAVVSAQAGRGARSRIALENGNVTLIDESYNANPASMRAALCVLAATDPAGEGRRIAVLGDMLELGPRSKDLHRGLLGAIEAAGVDLVFTSGPDMSALNEALDDDLRGAWAETSQGIMAPLAEALRAGDVVMVKGSLGSKMGPVVEFLKTSLSDR